MLQLVELEGWGYTMTLESRKVYHKTQIKDMVLALLGFRLALFCYFPWFDNAPIPLFLNMNIYFLQLFIGTVQHFYFVGAFI